MAVVIGYTGYSGSGKTYHMTKIALDLMKQGIKVYSRHEIKGARPILDDRELIYLENCHVFMDEWHQDHDAAQWRQLSPLVKHIVTQARKYGITIHWSAQDWRYMDSYIRRNTEDCWCHEALFPDELTGRSRVGIHHAWKVHGIEMELQHRKPKRLKNKFFRVNKKVITAYDSYKKILLTSAQVTDEEIASIKDPSERPRIQKISHIARGSFRQIELTPAELTPRAEPDPGDNLAADELVDKDTDAKGEQAGLDSHEQPDNNGELIQRNDEANNLRPLLKPRDPSRRFFRKRRDRRQKRGK